MVLPLPHWNSAGFRRLRKNSATTPPPTESRRRLETTKKLCYYPPPPLNIDGFRRSQKISATSPPPPLNRDGFRRSQKFSATTPPPLNRGDLALHTKGAPSLGKSWICDCIVVMIKSEKPVHTLRQCLNVQCEVASSNRMHKHEFVVLARQDSWP